MAPRVIRTSRSSTPRSARQADSDRLAVLRAGVELVLEEVSAAVEDWAPMRARATALATSCGASCRRSTPHELDEAQAFLEWLAEDHFTFLGYREYDLARRGPRS